MYYQQGDVLIIKVNKIQGKKLSHRVLMEGEITGHKHEVEKGEVELYEKEGTLYLRVKSETATITHPEHHKIIIPQGDYEIKRVREYDHFEEEAREVRD